MPEKTGNHQAKDTRFKPGQSGNPNGRPPGSSEKTKMWHRLGEYITGEGAERYMQILMEMDDTEFIKRFEMILEYFQPKQQRVEAKVESTHTQINISTPRWLRQPDQAKQLQEGVEDAQVIPEEAEKVEINQGSSEE